MTKTRKERRAEAIKRLKDAKATDPAWKQYSVYDMLNMLLGEADRSWVPNKDYDVLIDLLSEDECTRVPHPKRSFGPVYTCSVCGYGVGDDRWVHCPKCGSLIDRSKHGQD